MIGMHSSDGPIPSGNGSPHTSPANIRGSIPSHSGIIGEFACYVESVESLNEVMTGFVNQSVDFKDAAQVDTWTMKFEGLDRRLVW